MGSHMYTILHVCTYLFTHKSMHINTQTSSLKQIIIILLYSYDSTLALVKEILGEPMIYAFNQCTSLSDPSGHNLFIQSEGASLEIKAGWSTKLKPEFHAVFAFFCKHRK